MPVINARKVSLCAGCGERIEKDERIEYTLLTGARHLSCTDMGSESRRNLHPRPCTYCGVLIPKGQGVITCVERPVGESYTREWVAACVDIEACNGRIKGL